MTTKDTPFLTSFIMILLVAACSAGDNHTHSTPISTVSEPTTIPANASDNNIQPVSDRAPPVTTKEERNNTMKNDTSPGQASTPLPSSTKHLQTTKKSSKIPSPDSSQPQESGKSRVIIFVVLLIIVVMLIIAGCAHALWDPETRPNSCLYRFIIFVREGLRGLGDRVGLRPRGKTGEEDVTGLEEGHGEEGDREDDHSHDPSATQRNGQSEKVLSGREEEKNQKEDEEETSSESESSQCDVERERSGAVKEESEEIALVNSPQEHDEMSDLCDVTVL